LQNSPSYDPIFEIKGMLPMVILLFFFQNRLPKISIKSACEGASLNKVKGNLFEPFYGRQSPVTELAIYRPAEIYNFL
jgi:hypothetical protein